MEKLEPLHDVARMQMCSVTMENGVEIPQKTKTGTNIWRSNPTPEYTWKRTETGTFSAALLTIAKMTTI